jgi:hypothetical protein
MDASNGLNGSRYWASSLLIEDKRMRITRLRVGHRIFADLASLRIKLSDIALEIGREPDFAVFVSNEPVWS